MITHQARAQGIGRVRLKSSGRRIDDITNPQLAAYGKTAGALNKNPSGRSISLQIILSAIEHPHDAGVIKLSPVRAGETRAARNGLSSQVAKTA